MKDKRSSSDKGTTKTKRKQSKSKPAVSSSNEDTDDDITSDEIHDKMLSNTDDSDDEIEASRENKKWMATKRHQLNNRLKLKGMINVYIIVTK